VPVPDQQLRELAQASLGPGQDYAGPYLTTDIDAQASTIGIASRPALSDPGKP
jgi:hypothetical protein